MIQVEYLIALAMGFVEMLRKSNAISKGYSPYMAFGISIVLAYLSCVLGGQPLNAYMTDAFIKSGVVIGLFSAGTYTGGKMGG